MTIVICSDRDWTINDDTNTFLGKENHWKDLVMLLPGVIDGIKLLNTIPDSFFFIITNQSGVSMKHLDQLTEPRVHEVNEFIIQKLEEEGCTIDNHHVCPYVSKTYADKRDHDFHPEYVVDDHENLKPNPGMIKELIKRHNIQHVEMIYVIGDRASDVQTALNIGGKGILIPSPKTSSKKGIVVNDFLEAAQWIQKDVAKLRTNHSF